VLGCGFCVVGLSGYEVGYGRFGSQWVGVGCRVFLGGFVGWLVVAHCGGATHGLPWVALKCLVCGCGSIFGRNEICVSYL
jgi:hypothetical protein